MEDKYVSKYTIKKSKWYKNIRFGAKFQLDDGLKNKTEMTLTELRDSLKKNLQPVINNSYKHNLPTILKKKGNVKVKKIKQPITPYMFFYMEMSNKIKEGSINIDDNVHIAVYIGRLWSKLSDKVIYNEKSINDKLRYKNEKNTYNIDRKEKNKKPKNAYLIFHNKKFKEHENVKKEDKLSFIQFNKKISAEWKRLDNKSKNILKQIANQEMELYKKLLKS